MKKKSLLALLLALVMVFTMASTVMAAGEGSITIDNAINGQTYTIYRVLDLNDHNSDYSALNYKVSTKWAGFFAENGAGLKYVDIDGQGYVTWKKDASVSDFAADAIKYADEKGIVNDGQVTAANGKAEFKDLDLGYYLVKSGLGALCSLDTTMPNVTIKEKNEKPTIDKKVEENGVYGERNDANIGDIVKFRTTVNVVDGDPTNYVIHDVMSAGLTFREADAKALTVKIGDKTLVANTDYTLSTNNSDGCTFEISFKENVLKPNDEIVVDYTAMVNEKAVIAGTGNPNETKLTYKDDSKTEWSETVTYVWEISVYKYAEKNNEEIALNGAQFVLYKMVDGKETYVVVDANNKVTGWTTEGVKPETGADANKTYASVFETPANGKFVISGLDSGTYYLKEIKAPAGYNMLANPITVIISANYEETTKVGTATVKYGDAIANPDIKVLNQTGTELPSTGGIGTTVFYVLGSVLVLGAIVLLVTKRRMKRS